jgi:hypothetical protein
MIVSCSVLERPGVLCELDVLGDSAWWLGVERELYMILGRLHPAARTPRASICTQ